MGQLQAHLTNMAVPRLRRSVAGLSPRRPVLDPRSVRMKFLMHKVALWLDVSLPVHQFSPVSTIPPMLHTHSFTYHPQNIIFLSQNFSFPLSISLHQCSTLIFCYALVLARKTNGQNLEPSQSSALSDIVGEKRISSFLVFKMLIILFFIFVDRTVWKQTLPWMSVGRKRKDDKF